MPELPEVETVRRGLAPHFLGACFSAVEARRPDLRFPLPDQFSKRLVGARVIALSRRAKYLVADLSSGESLVMHLGMTGRFLVQFAGDAEAALLGDYAYGTGPHDKHAHVVFHMSGGACVIYSDPRRFGYMLLLETSSMAAQAQFSTLGVEPLGHDLTADYLAQRAAGKRTNLKAFLMDQRVIAGLGNIYVCEALHRARLSPEHEAASLSASTGKPTKHAVHLVREIRAVLEKALAAGGSTLRDYRHADGSAGGFQDEFQVYGREGGACLSQGCGGVIQRITQSQRSTFFCPRCQR